VVERLLLDGINAEARGAAIGGEHNLIAVPGAYEAQTPLALVQLAQAWAQVALDASVLQQVPIAAGFAGSDLLIHADLAYLW